MRETQRNSGAGRGEEGDAIIAHVGAAKAAGHARREDAEDALGGRRVVWNPRVSQPNFQSERTTDARLHHAPNAHQAELDHGDWTGT